VFDPNQRAGSYLAIGFLFGLGFTIGVALIVGLLAVLLAAVGHVDITTH
jgi:hypothetical protein